MLEPARASGPFYAPPRPATPLTGPDKRSLFTFCVNAAATTLAGMPAPPSRCDPPTLPATADPQPAPARTDTAWWQVIRALGRRAGPPSQDAALDSARGACLACLSDLPAIETRALCQLLGHAHAMVELWHLRPELYRTLALHHSQAEAERRLAVLGRLFDAQPGPSRSATALPS